jgi:hypothetical protein
MESDEQLAILTLFILVLDECQRQSTGSASMIPAAPAVVDSSPAPAPRPFAKASPASEPTAESAGGSDTRNRRLSNELRSSAIKVGEMARHLDKERKKQVITLIKSSMRRPGGAPKKREIQEAFRLINDEGQGWNEIFDSVLGDHYKVAAPREKARLERNLQHAVLKLVREAGVILIGWKRPRQTGQKGRHY